MKPKERVVAYIRVSTEEQADQGYSIEGQRSVLQEYAKRNDLLIVEHFEEHHSAFKRGRPAFGDMLTFLRERDDVSAVLVYKLDRLARNLRDYSEFEELESVRIISATEVLTPDSSGELMGGLLALMSKHYSRQLSERVKLGLETKASQGLWPSYAPTGYLNDRDSRGIVPDPERAGLVRQLFEVCARTGMSLDALSDWAKEHGLRTRQGGTLRKSAISKLLHNSIYSGPFYWRDRRYEGTHQPLITEELFNRVQERLNERPHSVTKRSFPYKGLLVCGHCGCQITAAYHKQMRYIYYRCTHGRGSCDQKYIREDRLGLRLLSVVERIRLTAGQVSELLNLIEESRGSRIRLRTEQLQGLEARRERLTRRREAAYEDKLDGRIGEERWLSMDRKWSSEDFQLKCEIDSMAEEKEPSVDDVQATLELLERAPDLYLRQSEFERARLLRLLVWNCQLTNESVDPVYRKPFDVIAEGLFSATWYAREDSNLRPAV